MATERFDTKRMSIISVTAVATLLILVTSVAVSGLLPLSTNTALPRAEPRAAAARLAMARYDAQGALKQTRAELGVSPMRDAAWLRLSELDAAAHGHLTSEGLDALSHAYDVAPYDLTTGGARARFAGAHYSELSAELRAEVDQERAALSR